jgi:hypothetical protein
LRGENTMNITTTAIKTYPEITPELIELYYDKEEVKYLDNDLIEV